MLVERRLHQRKWKWISHGSPEAHHLTSITPPLEDEPKERFLPLFLTTSTGLVFEYRIQKHSGKSSSVVKQPITLLFGFLFPHSELHQSIFLALIMIKKQVKICGHETN